MDQSMTVAFAAAGDPSPWASFGLMALIFGIFYFVVFAPMRKKQRHLQELVNALKKGDKVVTTGGLYGEVAQVEGSIVHLKIADKLRVRVAKSAIAGLEEQSGGAE